MLHTEPSFCIYNSEENQDFVGSDGQIVRSVTIGDIISDIGGNDFSFGEKGMGLIEEGENEEDEKDRVFDGVNELGIEESEEVISPMYLATGFGVDGNVVNSGAVDFAPSDFDGIGDVEEYYKRVLKEESSNPLFLRNYAQLLQSKGDLSGAEHYYFQATLADPKDGDTLSQYAKLVWELHRDKDIASDYFERAVHAAPENSDVLAAYACFLWDINDDESEDEMNMQSDKTKIEVTEEATASRDLDYEEDNRPVSSPLHLAAGLGIGNNRVGGDSPVDYTAAVSDMDGNAEEYYRRMIKENPHNPLLLRNYAQFLCQNKGDLLGAEEYYSRAILADPTDGETISHYAILIWQLYRDKSKASSYFKRAVQASPENSDVLAAYARFLWETEEDEDEEDKDETLGNHNGAPLPQGVVAANA
ncbi:uncharacterized protein [Nicotiana sylvestris]|uniref:Uncharacterized protein LOC104218994 isoform X2 n=1 Tax=Nicotiana sylvestris TaxID=4096 RepID=A0A1U7VIM8_NICSY|nr:PREDICTED: uncharacterized protein LOC104218994 isoform X2 [Nicotiana sylvestris]XP_016457168.1 PREDICTED: uncharacterized protein LOC107781058 isoform X2 [Nicotiana tabacum]